MVERRLVVVRIGLGVVKIGFGLRVGVKPGLVVGSSFGCSMAVVRTFVVLYCLSCYIWC